MFLIDNAINAILYTGDIRGNQGFDFIQGDK